MGIPRSVFRKLVGEYLLRGVEYAFYRLFQYLERVVPKPVIPP